MISQSSPNSRYLLTPKEQCFHRLHFLNCIRMLTKTPFCVGPIDFPACQIITIIKYNLLKTVLRMNRNLRDIVYIVYPHPKSTYQKYSLVIGE